MGNQRLQHDTASALAHTLLEIMETCLQEEERQDAFYALYALFRAAIERYEAQVDRRLLPSRN